MSAREVLDEIQARAVDGPESDWDPRGGDEPHYRAVERAIRFKKRLRADSVTLVAALRAVLDLHRPTVGGFDLSKPVCLFCERNDEPLAYPCPTVMAVERALGGSDGR